MIEFLVEPLRYEFVRHALVVCTVGGALCGLVGTYVTLRGLSYLGHGLSHAIFGGAALSAAAGVNVFVGSWLWGLGSGVAISRLARSRGGRALRADAAIGVITTAGFAFGVFLLGRYGTVKRSLDATIFGSVLGVTATDQLLVAAVAVGTVVSILAWYRPLLFATFDPEVADVSGVPAGRTDAVLMVLLCGVILTSMRVMGVTLIAATIVIPSAAARFLTDSFAKVLVWSAVIGGFTGLAGMYLSYHLDVASGATIVLVQFTVFVISFALGGRTRRTRTEPVS
ncbi:MAG: metal ABC transporter permease [Acidimicrobiales bacterium]|nr:metal ABC transporter permease [Acidimicrobiales bacterium]